MWQTSDRYPESLTHGKPGRRPAFRDFSHMSTVNSHNSRNSRGLANSRNARNSRKARAMEGGDDVLAAALLTVRDAILPPTRVTSIAAPRRLPRCTSGCCGWRGVRPGRADRRDAGRADRDGRQRQGAAASARRHRAAALHRAGAGRAWCASGGGGGLCRSAPGTAGRDPGAMRRSRRLLRRRRRDPSACGALLAGLAADLATSVA